MNKACKEILQYSRSLKIIIFYIIFSMKWFHWWKQISIDWLLFDSTVKYKYRNHKKTFTYYRATHFLIIIKMIILWLLIKNIRVYIDQLKLN